MKHLESYKTFSKFDKEEVKTLQVVADLLQDIFDQHNIKVVDNDEAFPPNTRDNYYSVRETYSGIVIAIYIFKVHDFDIVRGSIVRKLDEIRDFIGKNVYLHSHDDHDGFLMEIFL